MCISTSACASGPERLPLPVWQPAYGKNLEKLPDNKTTFLSADYANLVLVLKDTNGSRFVKTVSLNKQLKPIVRVNVVQSDGGQYQYLYRIANDVRAQDPILSFSIVIPAAFDNRFATTDGQIGGREWNGGVGFAVVAPQCEINGASQGRYAYWVGSSGSRYEILPGKARSGLGLKTSFRPGFTTSYTGGRVLLIPEDWDVDTQITSNLVWTTVHLPVIGPMFDKAAPCGEIIKNYHQGLSRLLQCDLPQPDKLAISTLLLKVDNSSSNCSQLLRATAQEASPTGLSSDIVSALRLALADQ